MKFSEFLAVDFDKACDDIMQNKNSACSIIVSGPQNFSVFVVEQRYAEAVQAFLNFVIGPHTEVTPESVFQKITELKETIQ